ncbi:Hypothetical protein A7982_11926 [Minicystis rosea]|nr:Hypothetical protein A7982_11926 [Minicystis rosea]
MGVGDYQVGDADGGTTKRCGFSFATAACASCIESTCCADAEACQADATCAPLHACITACDVADAACRNDCRAKHPVGDNAAAAKLDRCMSESGSCGGACSTCGGLADWYADGCSTCVKSICCDKAKACADDEACAERQRCYRACTYPSCPIDCDAYVAASVPPGDASVTTAFDTCVSKGCGKQCAYGAHWSCVGAFTWPAPTTAGTVKVTIRATSFTTDLPFPDATVRACPRADLDCAGPIVTGTTNAEGIAELDVPAGFTGYFDATATDTLESLVYLAWPLTSDTIYDLQLGPYELYKGLVMSGGGTVDDTKGALFVYTRDCLGDDAPGVHLDLDPPNIDGFYFVNGSPVALQQGTSTDAIGGFANVTPSTITLTAKLVESNKPIALFTALVRTKTLTYITLTPTP